MASRCPDVRDIRGPQHLPQTLTVQTQPLRNSVLELINQRLQLLRVGCCMQRLRGILDFVQSFLGSCKIHQQDWMLCHVVDQPLQFGNGVFSRSLLFLGWQISTIHPALDGLAEPSISRS